MIGKRCRPGAARRAPLARLSSPRHHLLNTDGDDDGEHGEAEDDQESVLLIRQASTRALHIKHKYESIVSLYGVRGRVCTHRCGDETGGSLVPRLGGIPKTASGAAGGVRGVAAERVEDGGRGESTDELDVGLVAWHAHGRHLNGVLRARLQAIDSPLKIAASIGLWRREKDNLEIEFAISSFSQLTAGAVGRD